MSKDPLDDLHARTKESIRKASETITSLEPAQNDSAAAPKKVVEVCLTCGTLAVYVLKALGSVYPVCSKVADVLSAAIQMEQGREENDVRIVSVYIELADFICELKLVKSPEGSITEQFSQSVIKPMEDLLLRFSEFSGKYYGPGTASRFRRLQNLCRNIISADKYQKSLDDFLNEIINLWSKLNSLLVIKIATTLDEKLHRIITSQTSIERAIGGYIDVTTQKSTVLDRKELEGLFRQHLTDPTLSQLFQDQNLGKILQSTLDEWKEMDKQNKAMFDLKFNFILDKFSAETKYLHDWLKKQADEGPHNIIPDLSFQDIWLQTAGKRSSVKRRQFIDGLSHYFALEMKRAEVVGSPADSWTTDIICSVPYHAAICDAIDRDASGYISVSEVVVFLQQKPQALGWTNLQWLAYCAYGWHADNLFYSEQLDELLSKIPWSGAYYKRFQHFEKPLRAIQNGLQPLAEDLTPWAAKNMDEMIHQRRGWITKGIESGLSKSFYRLEPSMVDSIAGGDQIEWWFFPVAFVLFSYHHEILSKSKGALPEHFLEDAQTSLKTLFETYDARVTELKRIWRRLPGDITKAMKYYANGLFAQYFTVFNVPQVSKMQTNRSKIKFIPGDVASNNPPDGKTKQPVAMADIPFVSRLPNTSSGPPDRSIIKFIPDGVALINSPADGKAKKPVATADIPFVSRLPMTSVGPDPSPAGAVSNNPPADEKAKHPVATVDFTSVSALPLVSRRNPNPEDVAPNDPPALGTATPPIQVIKVDNPFVNELAFVSQTVTRPLFASVSYPESGLSTHEIPVGEVVPHPGSDTGAEVANARTQDELGPAYVMPTLVLLPLDGSFQRKHLHLEWRTKLGKEVVGGIVAQEGNGIFSSQALSQVHAEVWEAAGKVYIKDLKSRNGTYINGQRLSPGGTKSKPFELKSGDTLHLGVNVGTVQRVAAQVFCIMKPDDLEALPQDVAPSILSWLSTN